MYLRPGTMNQFILRVCETNIHVVGNIIVEITFPDIITRPDTVALN